MPLKHPAVWLELLSNLEAKNKAKAKEKGRGVKFVFPT